MKERNAYTPEQIAGTERVIKVLMNLPENIRDTVAIAASAYIDGLIAGQALRDSEKDREVLADQ